MCPVKELKIYRHNLTHQGPHLTGHGTQKCLAWLILGAIWVLQPIEHQCSNLHSWCLLSIACGEAVSSRGHRGWGHTELQENPAVLFFLGERVQNLFIISYYR